MTDDQLAFSIYSSQISFCQDAFLPIFSHDLLLLLETNESLAEWNRNGERFYIKPT